MKQTIRLGKTKSGYAIYASNRRQTSFVPDIKSARILFRLFTQLPKDVLDKFDWKVR